MKYLTYLTFFAIVGCQPTPSELMRLSSTANSESNLAATWSETQRRCDHRLDVDRLHAVHVKSVVAPSLGFTLHCGCKITIPSFCLSC